MPELPESCDLKSDLQVGKRVRHTGLPSKPEGILISLYLGWNGAGPEAIVQLDDGTKATWLRVEDIQHCDEP